MLALLLLSTVIGDRDGGAERPCGMFTDDPGLGETLSGLGGEQGRVQRDLWKNGPAGNLGRSAKTNAVLHVGWENWADWEQLARWHLCRKGLAGPDGQVEFGQQCALWHCKLTAEQRKIYEVCKKVAGRSSEAIAPLCSALRVSSGMVSSFFQFYPHLPLQEGYWQMSNGSGVLVRDLDLVAYMEKVKEPALCGPGEEKSKGRCSCWLQLPKWNHVCYIAPFPNKSWCIAKGRKTAVTNRTKRNSS